MSILQIDHGRLDSGMRANTSAESIKLLHMLAEDQLQTGPAAC